MRVFITGATGYVGQRLTLKLAEAGYTVHALVRQIRKLDLLVHPNVIAFWGDLSDLDVINKGMEGCDKVYHMAAYVGVTVEDPRITYFKINTEGTRNILEAAKHHGVKKLVYTSTAGVLNPSGAGISNESTPRTHPFFNAYEESKHEAENLVREYAANGLNACIVNPPRIYGPGQRSESNSLSWMVEQYMKGKWHVIFGNGRSVGNFVYVDDVVDGHLLAMEKGRPGERYIIGGENADWLMFFEQLKEVTGKANWMVHVPVWALMGSAWFMKHYARITKTKPKASPEWVSRYLYNWRLSTEKAEKELGYKPTMLNEGLKKTVDWLKSESEL